MLGAYQLMASITSFILLVKSCVAFTRDPTQIEMVGQANFCTYDELFSINVFCCLFGIGNAFKIQHVANGLHLASSAVNLWIVMALYQQVMKKWQRKETPKIPPAGKNPTNNNDW